MNSLNSDIYPDGTKLANPVGDFLNGLFPVIARLFPTILIAIAVALTIVVAVHFLWGPIGQWRKERLDLVDSQQSPSVRRCAPRLTSRRYKERLRTAKLLGEMNDRTAVPALVRAMRRYRNDGAFLETAVSSLAQLGDARALPALRELTSGHHYRLMQAAREAVTAIESASILLRAAPESEDLLRPVGKGMNPEPQLLLRSVLAVNDRAG